MFDHFQQYAWKGLESNKKLGDFLYQTPGKVSANGKMLFVDTGISVNLACPTCYEFSVVLSTSCSIRGFQEDNIS